MLHIRSSEFIFKMFVVHVDTMITFVRGSQGEPECWLGAGWEGSLAVEVLRSWAATNLASFVGSLNPCSEKWLPEYSWSQHCQFSESASELCPLETWILTAPNWQRWDPCIPTKGLLCGLICIVRYTSLAAISKVSNYMTAPILHISVQFSHSVGVWLFVIPWTAACQASLSITSSQSLLKLMPIESVMPSNHLIHYHPLLLPPSIFLSIRVFSNESVLCITCPKCWSFSFSVSPSNE